MAGMAGLTAPQHRKSQIYKQATERSFLSHSIHFQFHHTTQPTINMFTYTALTLFAVLSQAVMGSPIEKRATNTVIRSGRNGQCLSLPSGVQPANGVQLVTRDCSSATRWDISPGSGSVIVTGTNFALDAGVPQGNNMVAKVWQSYPGSTQQTWFLTADNRIAVTGGNQCLDEGDNGPQTYQCTTGNTNQGMLRIHHTRSTRTITDPQSGMSTVPPHHPLRRRLLPLPLHLLPSRHLLRHLLRLRSHPPLVDRSNSRMVISAPLSLEMLVTVHLSPWRTATPRPTTSDSITSPVA
jgi:hypothetical protein